MDQVYAMILEGEGVVVGKGDTSMGVQGVGMGGRELGGKRGMRHASCVGVEYGATVVLTMPP